MTDITTIAASLSETHPTHDLLERLESIDEAAMYEAPATTQAAIEDAITRIRELEAENIRLREAAKPFAICPEVGRDGGEFVIAKALYRDMKGWNDTPPRAAHWHLDDFRKLASAISGETGK